MPLARVKAKFQVTISPAARHKIGLSVGDYVEETVSEDGVISLRPQAVVDRKLARDIAEARADYAAERVSKSFATVEEGFAQVGSRTHRRASARRGRRS